MKLSQEQHDARSFILTTDEVEKLLLNCSVQTWLLWKDKKGQSQLSTVIKFPHRVGTSPKIFVMHVSKSQEQEWEYFMLPGKSISNDQVLKSLSIDRLREQVFTSHKTPLTVMEFIAILQARELTNENITNLLPKSLEQLGEPDIKNKILAFIADIANLEQRIAFCNEILNNKLNPYSHILRLSEATWLFDRAPSKARILNIIQEARNNVQPQPSESSNPAPLTRIEIEKRKKELAQAEAALQNDELTQQMNILDSLEKEGKKMSRLLDEQKATSKLRSNLYSSEMLEDSIEVAAIPSASRQRFLSSKPISQHGADQQPKPQTEKLKEAEEPGAFNWFFIQ